METTIIIAAITLGLMSSLHCIGMCGPIAFSLGITQTNKIEFVTKNLTYQIGRVTTYTILGLIIGLAGKGISFAGFQNYLSIGVGVLMLLMVFLPRNLTNYMSGKSLIGKLLYQLKKSLGNFIRKKSYVSLYITGLLNGLLPCGAVYVALAAALAVGSLKGAGIFMFIFGLGTIPLMFLTVIFGATINLGLRNRILKILPVITACIAVLFILRGLELGIPYISPPQGALEIHAKAHCH